MSKKWSNISASGIKTISQCGLEISKDGTFIVVRDFSVKIREELTDEEMRKWADDKFINYINLKNQDSGKFFRKNADPLMDAA